MFFITQDSFCLVGLGPQFESCAESFVDEEINGKALLTINTEYLAELAVSQWILKYYYKSSINQYFMYVFSPRFKMPMTKTPYWMQFVV